MQTNRAKAPLELEIQSLLILHGSADQAAAALFQKYQKRSLSLAELETISVFCLHAGLPASLLEFLRAQLSIDAILPWGHFVEALSMAAGPPDRVLRRSILEGADEQNMTDHLAKSHVMDSAAPQLIQQRERRRSAHQERLEDLKRDLVGQVEMYRSQGLDREEEAAFQKLLRLFPRDPDIQLQYHDFRSRKALQMLELRTRSENMDWVERDPLPDADVLAQIRIVKRSMREAWAREHRDPQLALDFAVALWIWEDLDSCLEFLEDAVDIEASHWLRFEVLLRQRRFVDLLAEIVQWETYKAHDPEATFALAYLRAQAFWGLGQRFEAIDILEGLLNVKPHYRSGGALLASWKERTK